MPGIKISALPPINTISDGDRIPIVDISAGPETKYVSILQLDTRYFVNLGPIYTDISILSGRINYFETLASGKIFMGNSGITTQVTPSGDVTMNVSGVNTIANNAVTNVKLADMPANTIKGNNTVSPADPKDLTGTEVTALLNPVVGDTGAGGTKGLVPAPGAGDAAADKYLKADGTWDAVGGGGGAGLSWYIGPGFSGPESRISNSLYSGNPFFPQNQLAFGYTPGDQQTIFCKYVIPSSYKAGNIIKLINGKFSANSSDTSKRVKYRLRTFLLKSGDSIATLANAPYTSANAEVAISGTANTMINIGNLNTMDTLGVIDGRAAGPGDALLMMLDRDIANESVPLQDEALLLVDAILNGFDVALK